MKQIINGFLRIKNPNLSIALRDLFATGCYLILNGKKNAGRKICRAALSAAGIKKGITRFNKNITLDLDHKKRSLILKLVQDIKPHYEVQTDLFEI